MSSNRRQAAPRGPGWAHELKHDGYRLQIHVRNGRVRLYTMNGANWTDRYSCIIEEAARIKGIVSCGRWRLKFGMVVRGRGQLLTGEGRRPSKPSFHPASRGANQPAPSTTTRQVKINATGPKAVALLRDSRRDNALMPLSAAVIDHTQRKHHGDGEEE